MKREELEKLSKERLIDIILGRKNPPGKPGYGFASLAVGECRLFEIEPPADIDANGYLEARGKLIKAMDVYNCRNKKGIQLVIDQSKSDWHGVWIFRQK